MHSGHYDFKSDLTSSKYSSSDYLSNKKHSKVYQPYNGYDQKMYDQGNRSYQTYYKYKDEKRDKSDYLEPVKRQYKQTNDYRNSVNILPSYQSELSKNRQKRKHTADYSTSRNHSPHFADNKKQKSSYQSTSKKYESSHLEVPSTKYDLTSSSVSAITSYDYNKQKKKYLDSSRVDQLAKSAAIRIPERSYGDIFQKEYQKDDLKQKYNNYFTSSNTRRTTAADDNQPSRIKVSLPSFSTEQVSLIPHRSESNKQYSSKSARDNYKNYDYDSKHRSSNYDNKDKYQLSSYNSNSQEKLDTRFAKKKYQQQTKVKIQELNQLLNKSRKISDSNSKEQFKYARKSQSIPSRIDFNVKISDFNLGRSKGEGKFGTVFQAIHKVTGSLYAIKRIPKQIIKSNMLEAQLALQIKLQMYIDHPNILKMYEFFDDWQNIYIVLEYMQEGTLFEYLKKRSNKLTQKQVSKKIKQMTDAIKYLHDLDIAHRDIKPQNIVISNGISKLCDFGWATRCTDRRKTYCGTFDYAAPQILQGRQYDWCVDLWCLGVLTFELLVGKAPFYHISRKQTMKKILRIDRDQIDYPKDMSWKAKDFIQSLLKKNPNQRRTAQELINHPFLTEQK